ncbi:hypothetical protein ACJJIU_22300 (plasmid) [Microbulbifer sp. CnH-101-E]|uniref:hypothetical protein n=1 Tax=unclassified Microbulbifer TaxID=2619833 RepID=UPI00403955FC
MDAKRITPQNTQQRAQARADQAARVAAKIALNQGVSVSEALAIQHRLRQTLAGNTPKAEVKTAATVHCIALARTENRRNCAACTVRPHSTAKKVKATRSRAK